MSEIQYVGEEQFNLLLRKEWLVKVDAQKSVPYLLKFYSSTVDQCCCVIITDTRNVWGEVLSSKRFARRWRDCNLQSSPSFAFEEEEDEWRTRCLELLSTAHSLGGFQELSFDVVESRYADFAFEIVGETFKWRWETFHVGPKASADLLSKHLIMPLISVTHLAFSSADPVSELSETDLEKAVDKVGRTARRTVDTHVKHAISRPRAATTLRRMTAMFNFLPDLPSISSTVERPDLSLPSLLPRSRAPSKPPQARVLSRPNSPEFSPVDQQPAVTSAPLHGRQAPNSPVPAANDDSATEAESAEDESPPAGSAPDASEAPKSKPRSALPSRTGSPARVRSKSRQVTPENVPSRTQTSAQDSSSPEPALKRVKRAPAESSSDEDSEAERRKRVAQLKSSTHRGAKQPLKRGGRRF